jgi:Cyclic nucleotide-binding domain
MVSLYNLRILHHPVLPLVTVTHSYPICSGRFLSPLPGDVTAENTLERTYSIFIMFLGAGTFAFVISQVGFLVRELSASNAFYRSQMDQLTAFSVYRRLPDSLTYDIRRYFQHRRRWQLGEKDDELLGAMSTDLRSKVMKHMYEGAFEQSRIIRSVPRELRGQLFERMQSMFGRPGEVLYVAGDTSDHIYSIRSGSVRVYDSREGVQTLGPGDVFGENEVLFGRPRQGAAKCLKYCDLALAPRSAVISALNRDQDAFTELRKREGSLLWAAAFTRAENEVAMYNLACKLRSCGREHVKDRKRAEAIAFPSTAQSENVSSAAASFPSGNSELVVADAPLPAEDESALSEVETESDPRELEAESPSRDASNSDSRVEGYSGEELSIALAEASAAEAMTRVVLEREYVARGLRLKRLEARSRAIWTGVLAMHDNCA